MGGGGKETEYKCQLTKKESIPHSIFKGLFVNPIPSLMEQFYFVWCNCSTLIPCSIPYVKKGFHKKIARLKCSSYYTYD